MSTNPLNGDQPASQDDLATLAGEMTTRFTAVDKRLDGLEGRMDKLEGRMDGLERGVTAVLDVVNSIDQQLKEWKDIPEKVERVHRRVFGPHG